MDQNFINEQRKRSQEVYKHPFEPSHSGAQSELRIANALEYIAAQLHHISAKLDRLVEVELACSSCCSTTLGPRLTSYPPS